MVSRNQRYSAHMRAKAAYGPQGFWSNFFFLVALWCIPFFILWVVSKYA